MADCAESIQQLHNWGIRWMAVAQKAAWLGMVHCPQCLARTRIAVELFSSPLTPDSLYAETQPKAEGLPA